MFRAASKEESAEGAGAGRIAAVELKKTYMGYPFVECRSECFCGERLSERHFSVCISRKKKKNRTIVKKCIRQKRMDMI